MKTNPFVKDRDRIMAKQGISREERANIARYLTGFCNWIAGFTYTAETAIDYIQENNIKGNDAVAYINEQLQNQETRINQSLMKKIFDWY